MSTNKKETLLGNQSESIKRVLNHSFTGNENQTFNVFLKINRSLNLGPHSK